MKSTIYCHDKCQLWYEDDGCCAWITFKKKDVRTAERYETIKTKKEFVIKHCMYCEMFLDATDERIELIDKQIGIEKTEQERLDTGISFMELAKKRIYEMREWTKEKWTK